MRTKGRLKKLRRPGKAVTVVADKVKTSGIGIEDSAENARETRKPRPPGEGGDKTCAAGELSPSRRRRVVVMTRSSAPGPRSTGPRTNSQAAQKDPAREVVDQALEPARSAALGEARLSRQPGALLAFSSDNHRLGRRLSEEGFSISTMRKRMRSRSLPLIRGA